MMMMLVLVSSLAFQITFGEEPLASISRPMIRRGMLLVTLGFLYQKTIMNLLKKKK